VGIRGGDGPATKTCLASLESWGDVAGVVDGILVGH
jgi:hypothetical protein